MKNLIIPALVSIILLNACRSGQNKGEEITVIKIENRSDSSRVDITVGGKPFTSYVYTDTLKKPILWPVIAANGVTVTRGFPFRKIQGERTDHPHQTGFWFNYGNVNGIDFWGNGGWVPDTSEYRFGTVRFVRIDSIVSNKDKSILAVTHEWVNSRGQVLILENTVFSFMAGEDYRVIDRHTTFTAKVPEVTFFDTKEGAVAIRVAHFLEFASDAPRVFIDAQGNKTEVPASEDTVANGNYRSSEGIEGVKVWGTRAKWMKLYGVSGSDTLSVSFMDHPVNPNFPTYWHARDYGLFSANPFGAKDFTNGNEVLNLQMNEGESLIFRHRLYIKSGKGLTPYQAEKEWMDFSAN